MNKPLTREQLAYRGRRISEGLNDPLRRVLRQKPCCKHGHPFEDVNTTIDSHGHRICLTCKARHQIEYWKRKKGRWPMIEADIKKNVKKYLHEIGAWYYMPVYTGYGKKGIDFFVCYKGLFYGIETKRPGIHKPTKNQECVMSDIAKAGGGVCVENDPEIPNVRRMMESSPFGEAWTHGDGNVS